MLNEQVIKGRSSMWIDPKTYINYHKLPVILEEAQQLFEKTSLDQLREVGFTWPGRNAFSLLVINKETDKVGPEVFKELLPLLKDLPGLKQCFINIIGPNTDLQDHKDDQAIGDINSPSRCYQIVLAIKIPSTDPEVVGFHVNNEIRSYDSGAIVAFDGQTYTHGGWNRSADYRITMCIDFDNSLSYWAATLP